MDQATKNQKKSEILQKALPETAGYAIMDLFFPLAFVSDVYKRQQCATCSMVSTCLFRALKFLSCRDSRVKEEACRWPQGKTLRLEIPGARGFTVTGTEKGFRKLPQDTPGDVTIRFKSPDDAFRVFTGQIGIAQAYAQHRFTLRGNKMCIRDRPWPA